MRTVFRKTLTVVLLASCVTSIEAAEWKIDPTLRLKGGYNDNIRLSIDDEVSSAFATLSPSAVFSMNTPTSGASGEVRFDFRRYEDDSNLDDNNSRLNLRSHHEMERSRLGLDIDFVKDTTLDSQLEATGLIFARVRRQRINISPNWRYSLNESTFVEAAYSYSDVEYKNAGGTGFVNYDLNSARASLTHALNQRTNASITLSRTKSNNDNNVESTNTNLQGGGTYRFSETLSTSLFAGIRRTEVDFRQSSLIPIFSGDTIIGFVPLNEDVSNSDWGYTFSGSVTKSFLHGESTFSASRDISNDINGTPFEVDRFRLLNFFRLSETLSGNLNLEFYNSQTSNSARRDANREYYQIEPKLAWQFKKFWSLSGSYRYRKQTFDDTNDDATQNTVYLTLAYLWPRIAVSR